MTPALAHCPFCGHDGAQMLEDPFTYLLTVRCQHCGIEVGWFISQKVAAFQWNLRAPQRQEAA